jgi:hypothetical protein
LGFNQELKMAKMFFRSLMQAGRVINNPFTMNNGYVLPKHGDAQLDLAKVVGDMRAVGRDLKKTALQEVKRHGS